MDILGNTVARVALRADAGIVDLAWNCERFSMEEQDEQNQNQNQLNHQQNRSSNNALRSSHGKKRSDGELVGDQVPFDAQLWIIHYSNNSPF